MLSFSGVIPPKQCTRLRVIILKIKKMITIMGLALILACGQANAATVEEVKATIVNQAIELGIDPALALSIAKVESNFRMEARSACGAVGIFQLMPTTARKIGINPYSMADNIRGGLKYYLMMYRMFGSVELRLRHIMQALETLKSTTRFRRLVKRKDLFRRL